MSGASKLLSQLLQSPQRVCPWSLSAQAVGWAAEWEDSSTHGALVWLVPSEQAVVAATIFAGNRAYSFYPGASTLLFFPFTKNA